MVAGQRVALTILNRLEVLNLAAREAGWEVVLQQTMVALVYLVQAEAEVVSREEEQARTVVHGVTIPPRLAHLEAMEGQGQLLEPQERAETMVLEMAEAEAVLELEEVPGGGGGGGGGRGDGGSADAGAGGAGARGEVRIYSW
mgnify:CR=1 FL=1